jgi:hypothetical protein
VIKINPGVRFEVSGRSSKGLLVTRVGADAPVDEEAENPRPEYLASIISFQTKDRNCIIKMATKK